MGKQGGGVNERWFLRGLMNVCFPRGRDENERIRTALLATISVRSIVRFRAEENITIVDELQSELIMITSVFAKASTESQMIYSPIHTYMYIYVHISRLE